MTDHALTPKKPATAAAIAGMTVTALITVACFLGGLLILPPVAWWASGDHAFLADPYFFGGMIETLLKDALAHSTLLEKVVGVTDVPFAFVEALNRHSLTPSMSARVLSSLVAGVLLGNLAYDAIYTSKVPVIRVWHIAGPRLRANRAARRGLSAVWRKRFGRSEPGIELARGLTLPRALEVLHFLLVGGTGAGKTTILQHMIGSALGKGDRMFMLDVKGDMTACFPSDAFVLLSIEDFRSDKWVPGWDFLTAADADELAIVLILATSDPSWSNGARKILSAIIRFLQKEMSVRRKAWTWKSLDRMLKMSIDDIHRILASFDPQAAAFIDVTQDETRKQAMSFYLVMLAGAAQTVEAFAAMGDAGPETFSIRRWFEGKDPRRAVILRQSQRSPQVSAMMVRLLLKVAADTAAEYAAEAAPAPTWFFLDEVAQIGKSEAVPRLAAIGRSAGIRMVTAVQSPSQLREIYGADGSQALLDNFTTKIVGRVAAGATADEISEKWIGTRKVEWWETVGRDEAGRSKAEKKTGDVPVVDSQFLTDELGFATSFVGNPTVKALVLGHRDVGLLTWTAGIWPIRRDSVVRPEDARRMAKYGRSS